MFHFASILNSDAMYDKYAEKSNILHQLFSKVA